MVKRGILGFFVIAIFLEVVSAQSFDFNQFIENDVVKFVALFLLLLSVIFYSALKIFPKVKGVAVVVALTTSFFATYYIFKNKEFLDFFEKKFLWVVLAMIILLILLALLFRKFAKGGKKGERGEGGRGERGERGEPGERGPPGPSGPHPPGPDFRGFIELIEPPQGSRFQGGTNVNFRFHFINVQPDFNDNVDFYVRLGDNSVRWVHKAVVACMGTTPAFYRVEIPGVERETRFSIMLRGQGSGASNIFEFVILPGATPPGEIRIELVSPPEGSEFTSGQTVPFRFRFVGAPRDYRDSVKIYASINRARLIPISDEIDCGVEGDITLHIPPVDTPSEFRIIVAARLHNIQSRIYTYRIVPEGNGEFQIQLTSPAENSEFNSGQNVPFDFRLINAPNNYRGRVTLYGSIGNENHTPWGTFEVNGVREGTINVVMRNVNVLTEFKVSIGAENCNFIDNIEPLFITPRVNPPGDITIELLSPAEHSNLISGTNQLFRLRFLNAPADFRDNVKIFSSLGVEGFAPASEEKNCGAEDEITIQIPIVTVQTDFKILITARNHGINSRPFVFIIVPQTRIKDIILISPLQDTELKSEENQEFSFRFQGYSREEISQFMAYPKLNDGGWQGGKWITFSNSDIGRVTFLLPHVDVSGVLTIGLGMKISGTMTLVKEFQFKIKPKGGGGNRKVGGASFNLIVNNKKIDNIEEVELNSDLLNNNSSTFKIENGGSGGLLTWKAASSKGLILSQTSGKLKKGEYIDVTVQRDDRNFVNYILKLNPHVTIIAKRGQESKEIREFFNKKIAKAIIYYRIL